MDVAGQYCQNETALIDLSNCARNVTECVIHFHLLDNVKTSDDQIVYMDHQQCATDLSPKSSDVILIRQDEMFVRIFIGTDNLFHSMGNAAKMIRHAKILAQV